MYLYYVHISRLPPTPTHPRTIIQCCLCQLFVKCSLLCLCHVRVNHVLFIVSYMCHVFVSNNVIYVSFICFIYMCRLLCHFASMIYLFISIFCSCYFFIIVYLIFSIFVSIWIFWIFVLLLILSIVPKQDTIIICNTKPNKGILQSHPRSG